MKPNLSIDLFSAKPKPPLVYPLNPKTYFLFLLHNYNNTSCRTLNEFQRDVDTIGVIKRAFLRYMKTGNIKTKEIVNSIVTMKNIFGVQATCFIIFFQCPKECWSVAATFLNFLDILPEEINSINGEVIDTQALHLESKILMELREILAL